MVASEMYQPFITITSRFTRHRPNPILSTLHRRISMADVHPSDPTATQAISTNPIPTDPQEISIHLHHSDQIPDAAQAIPIDEEALRQALDKLKDDHKKVLEKIHRFPASLREFCEDCRYIDIAPKVVAMGPYYHGLPELQEMEEFKKAATYLICRATSQSLEVAYKKVLAVAGNARRCYDWSALDGVSDTAFAAMMFHDACFLVLIIDVFTGNYLSCPRSLQGRIGNTHIILRDIFLLENQIPWVVLEALEIHGVVKLFDFICWRGMTIQSRFDRRPRPLVIGSYRPPHLLGLFHFYQSGCGSVQEVQDEEEVEEEEGVVIEPEDMQKQLGGTIARFKSFLRKKLPAHADWKIDSIALATSAIELAEIGVKLTPSKTAEFKDIGLTKGPLFPRLFVPPLHLSKLTASWLLNMAAFEACTTLQEYSWDNSAYYVCSYLSVFKVLMNREEDVHELRAKRLILGGFSDQQTLDFLNGLGSCLLVGGSYDTVIKDLERYKKKMRVWITIHRFVYNNIKTIVTVLSIMSVLVAILKTLLSLKQ